MMSLELNPSWLEGVAYDSAARCHRLDGQRVPSVTQVLDRAYPNRFAHVPRNVLAHAAAIGTAVHYGAQLHVERDLANGPLLPAIDVRLEAWKWFCASRRVRPLLCEAVVCSRDVGLPPARRRPYVGRLDYLCVVDVDTVVLLDLKTGEADLAGLQTMAYLDCLYQQFPALIAVDIQRWAVQLTADGRHVIQTFRDDATDAREFRAALECAYRAPDVEWRTPMAEMPMFDLPDDDGPLHGPGFELPEEPDDPPPALTGDVLAADAPPILELRITPDIDTYLTQLEAAIAPYEATAKGFAEFMETMPLDTPEQLAAVGQQALVAKEREKLLDELFDPAIRGPRVYLDRVYSVKRRVMGWVKTGGETAARRYTARRRELEEADRRARSAAAWRQREAELEAERVAKEARQRLAQEAAVAAQAGNAVAAANLIEQARAVEAQPVVVEPPPVSQAAAATVAGMGTREGWAGEITDIHDAIMACARPHIMREIAAMVADGDLTAGGQGIATTMIAERLRALASDLPTIPTSMFVGDAAELKKRANADRDTLSWPGFTFSQTVTPVRRMGRKSNT